MVLLISQFHIGHYRVAYWNKISKPIVAPKYNLGFDFWWFDPKKTESLGEIKMPEKEIDKKDNKIIFFLLFFFFLFIFWRIRRKNT